MDNFLSYLTIRTGNQWLDFNLNALILALVIVLVPILVAFIIPLFEHRKGQLRSTVYLYAFTAGFFVVLGLFGEANEGRELAADAAAAADPGNFWLAFGYQAAVLLPGGIIGLGGALTFKYLINKKMGNFRSDSLVDPHDSHPPNHNHPHVHEFLFNRQNRAKANRSKTTAIYLVLSHRLAAGLFLGYIINQVVMANYQTQTPVNPPGINLAFFVAFFLHLVPEEAIIYYRQREMGVRRSRSILNSILMVLVLVPFIFLGANIGAFVVDLWWLNGIIHVVVGVLFTFTALVEFFPEIVQEAKNQRKWYITILWVIMGILACFALVAIGE